MFVRHNKIRTCGCLKILIFGSFGKFIWNLNFGQSAKVFSKIMQKYNFWISLTFKWYAKHNEKFFRPNLTFDRAVKTKLVKFGKKLKFFFFNIWKYINEAKRFVLWF